MAGGDSTKADQIAFHIYTKLFLILPAARASDQGPPSGKTDKWFNLETPLAASGFTPTAELEAYRALSAFSTSTSQSTSTSLSSLWTASDSSSTSPPPPLAIRVLLGVPPPGGGTALVHAASGTCVEPEPRLVLVEEWVLAFSPTASTSSATSTATSTASGASTSSTATTGGSSSSGGSTDEVLPPTIYKNAIPLFRALYALLRILPAWRAGRKLAGRRGGGQAQHVGHARLRVVVRVREATKANTGGTQGTMNTGVAQTTMNTGATGGVGRGVGLGGGGGNGGNGAGGNDTILAFGASPAPGSGAPPLPTITHIFPKIPHPAAAPLDSRLVIFFFLILLCSSTEHTDAVRDVPHHTRLHAPSLEALLSSRFAVLDARPSGAGGYTNDNSGYNNDDVYNNNTRSSFPNTDARGSGAGTNPRPARTPLRPGLDTRGVGTGVDAYGVGSGARSPHARGASKTYTGGRGDHLRRRSRNDVDEDEDAEFMPTLARRSITTSSVSLGVGGAGMSSSPGRHTVPLPGAGVSGSPGRYGAIRLRIGTVYLSSERGTDNIHPRRVGLARAVRLRTAAAAWAPALSSTTSPSPAPSYRIGVHVASGSGVGAGYRRDVGAAGGGDVVDRFVSLGAARHPSPRSHRSIAGASASPSTVDIYTNQLEIPDNAFES
ncbi:hypothetical protein C8R43DRAFT_1193362 [Mycena crocata]|nr:hypothetical protein C8R43DRAFT_1193362 [Mycena crocata]